MDNTPNPLDYNATINRMEYGIAPVDMVVSTASIAISLKRIADMMEDPNSQFNQTTSVAAMDAAYRVSSAINSHSTKVYSVG